MDLKLTNYAEYNLNTQFNQYLSSYLIDSKNKNKPVPFINLPIRKPVTINDILQFISTDKVFSYKKDVKINIIFEDFSNFTNTIFKTKKFFKADKTKIKESSWQDESNNAIHILKSDFNPQLSILSKNLLDSGFKLQDVLNFIILHEIGHSIQNNLFSVNKKCFSINKNQFSQFVNEINFYKGYFQEIGGMPILDSSNISRIFHTTLKESFADLFAIHAIHKIYPLADSKIFIESIIKSRKDLQPYEKYFTFDLLNNTKETMQIFSSFTQLQNHFESLISQHLKETISSLFKEQNSHVNFVTNHFLGFINKKLDLELKDSNQVSEYITTSYNLNIRVQSTIENVFKNGEQSIISYNQINQVFQPNPPIIPKFNSITNIGSLRKQFNVETVLTTNVKNKI